MPPLDPDERLLQRLRSATRPDAGELHPDLDDSFLDDPFFDDDPDDAATEAVDARLARIAAALRDDPEPPVGPPPAGLWDRIAAAAGVDEADAAGHGRHRAGGPGGDSLVHGGAPDPRVSSPDGVVPFDARRRRSNRAARRSLQLAAAAAVLAVVTTIGVVAGRDDRGPDVEAEVALAPLEGGATGAARLERLPDGSRRLALTEQVAAVPDGSYLEVWLIDPDSGLTRMVSLGPAGSGSTFAIPSSIDPTTYRVVDVSIEPADGNPTHSGRSVLRGTLEI
jgi:hypothetical protein